MTNSDSEYALGSTDAEHERLIRQAEVIARKIEDKDATAYVLSGMGDVALDRGDLVLSRKRYEESLDLRNQAGEKQTATESRVYLAKLAVEEGHATDAETSARACKQQFQQDQQRDDELSASIALIDALLAEGKQGEAQKEMEAAQALGDATQNRFLRLQFELASGRVELASDHPDASRAIFQRVAGDAHRYGFVGIELSDELAMAELATKRSMVRRPNSSCMPCKSQLLPGASDSSPARHFTKEVQLSNINCLDAISASMSRQSTYLGLPIFPILGPESQPKTKYYSRNCERLTQPCCKCLQILLTARLKRLVSETKRPGSVRRPTGEVHHFGEPLSEKPGVQRS